MFVNTGQEFDGSDSGARPDEAVSWGKIKITASPVKVKNARTCRSFFATSQLKKNCKEVGFLVKVSWHFNREIISLKYSDIF